MVNSIMTARFDNVIRGLVVIEPDKFLDNRGWYYIQTGNWKKAFPLIPITEKGYRSTAKGLFFPAAPTGRRAIHLKSFLLIPMDRHIFCTE